MNLKNDVTSLVAGIVFQLMLIGLAVGLTIVLMIPSCDGAGILIIVVLECIIGGLAVISLSEAFVSLSFFEPKSMNSKTDYYYDLKPIYYSENGPKGSDAVICLVRSSDVESKWQPKIVALNHFIPKEAQEIRDLFNVQTGKTRREIVLTVKSYSAQKGKILLFAEPEEFLEEEIDVNNLGSNIN